VIVLVSMGISNFAPKEHAKIAEIADALVDVVLYVGELWGKVGMSRDEAEQKLKDITQPGDVVLLKGARSHALEELIERCFYS